MGFVPIDGLIRKKHSAPNPSARLLRHIGIKQIHSMKQAPLFLLFSLLTLYGFQCGNRCFLYYDISFFEISHVNNAGLEPVQDSTDVPASVYGIRMKPVPEPDFSNYDCEDGETSIWGIGEISVVTLRPFDTLPAGSDITDYFLARLPEAGNNRWTPQYVSVEEGEKFFDILYYNQTKFYIDLLLNHVPEGIDTCLFDVQFRFKYRPDTIVHNRLSPIILQ